MDLNYQKNLFDDITHLEGVILSLQEIHYEIKKLKEFCLIEHPVENILKLYAKNEMLEKNISDLQKSIQICEDVEEEIRKARKKYSKLEKELHSNFPDVCPLCGSKLIKK